jgi:serine/threonine protein kinase
MTDDGPTPPDSLGEWNLGRRLGKGAFGQVFLCSAKKDPSNIQAMKIMPVTTPSSKKDQRIAEIELATMYTEQQIYSFIRQYNSVHFPTFFKYSPNEKGWRYMVLEKFDSGDLSERLDLIKSPEDCFTVALHVIGAFKVLHLRYYAYRDLKPNNIMFRGAGREAGDYTASDLTAVLLDFGLATKYVDQFGKLTQDGNESGSAAYVALATHDALPARPRDDLECLVYVLAWMLRGGNLPWSEAKSKKEVVDPKKSMRDLVTGPGKEVFEAFRDAVMKIDRETKKLDYAPLEQLLIGAGAKEPPSVADKKPATKKGSKAPPKVEKPEPPPKAEEVEKPEPPPKAEEAEKPERRTRSSRKEEPPPPPPAVEERVFDEYAVNPPEEPVAEAPPPAAAATTGKTVKGRFPKKPLQPIQPSTDGSRSIDEMQRDLQILVDAAKFYYF